MNQKPVTLESCVLTAVDCWTVKCTPCFNLLSILFYNFPYIELDDLRKRAWPVILNNTPIWDQVSEEEIEHHHYYNQVVLDVKRILKRFPPGTVEWHWTIHFLQLKQLRIEYWFYFFLGIDEVIQADLQVKVTHLIIRVLIRNEGLHYYQVVVNPIKGRTAPVFY